VRTRETEDILHRTLLLAQRAADEAVAEATAKSKQMLDDAESSSRRMVAESEAEARRKGDTERRRLEEEVVELAGRRDTLLADVEALTRFEGEYRERMLQAIETDLTELRNRPTTAPGERPEPSDVEIPAEVSAPAAPAPADVVEPVEAPPTPPALPTRGDEHEASATNGRAAAGRDEAKPQVVSPPETSTTDSETSEVDMSTLFQTTADAPAPGVARHDDFLPSDREQSVVGAPVVTGFQPLDLGDPDSLEGDILDDDAFFATLRDAVTDDAPLGPRDDDLTGENRFFDQDADRSSFRDVFRRRR